MVGIKLNRVRNAVTYLDVIVKFRREFNENSLANILKADRSFCSAIGRTKSYACTPLMGVVCVFTVCLFLLILSLRVL